MDGNRAKGSELHSAGKALKPLGESRRTNTGRGNPIDRRFDSKL
jgi:hypothetical protein